ncbi:TPA: P-loop NTPase fold protein [Enterococcus faecalis]|nr:P-loop ATPase [Enterococcus faecalis]
MEEIDTSVAAENLCKLLNSNKTFFLNGSWGSGKTEFLHKVEKKAKGKKFVYLDLWSVKNNRSVIGNAFYCLHPLIYTVSKLLVLVCIVVSLLMTPAFNFGIQKWLVSKGGNWIVYIAAIIALSVSVWQFLKAKTDEVYIYLMPKFLKNKVLIFDDFDRVEEGLQKDSYKVFNLLNGKIPIIFLGDYSKFALNEDKFLQKIIDVKVELPYVLHSVNIWNSYIDNISSILKENISWQFSELVIKDGRNLRERKQFNDYVNQQFFSLGKFKHVQASQQLVVIYLYLFYPLVYKEMVNSSIDEAIKNSEDTKFNNISEYVQELLADNDRYPESYVRNKRMYFLYEAVSNLTIEEAEDILENEDVLKKYLKNDRSNKDFDKYVRSSYYSFTENRKEYLLDTVIEVIREGDISLLNTYVINEKNLQLLSKRKSVIGKLPNDQNDSYLYEKWSRILEKKKFSISQQFFLLEECGIFSFYKLGKLSMRLNIEEQYRILENYREYYLLTYLSQGDLWYKYEEWSQDIWKCVDDLSDTEYLSFWKFCGIIRNENFVREISSNVNILINRKFKNIEGEVQDLSIAIKHMEERIKSLEDKGYIFHYN